MSENHLSLSLSFQRLSDNAIKPSRGTAYSAGYDLYSAEDVVVEPLSRKLIKTNIALAIPLGFYGRIAPRSGLALKHGIDVLAGVIDSDYRGDIGVILYNTDTNNSYSVRIGDRIAQIIFEKCYSPILIESNLSQTDRANNGYGHTGK